MLLQHNTHFPSGFDSLPDAEEADNPHCQKTQGQVPLQGPDVLNPRGDTQDVPSADKTRDPYSRLMAFCGSRDGKEHRYTQIVGLIEYIAFQFLKGSYVAF